MAQDKAIARNITSNSDPGAPGDEEINATLDRLFDFYPVCIDMGLARVERLLHALGDPHLNLPPVLHVAGTNGKGSTLAFLKAIMEAAGYRVHVFTSPHLVRYNERVVLAGQEIDNKTLHNILIRCEQANAGEPITFFEITTVASFLAFSEVPADVVLLETGMGGRLDATNVIPDPALTFISAISYDHAQYLGPTLPQIAGEKAGIIKRSAPAIIGYQSREAIESGVDILFEDKAKQEGTKAFFAGEHWSCKSDGHSMTFRGFDQMIELPLPGLAGPHQIHNAGLAIAGLCKLRHQDNKKWDLPDSALKKGVITAQWPARLQRLEDMERSFDLPAGTELWLDGGHNDSAGLALAGQAEIWRKESKHRIHIILAMLNTKHPEDFISPLLPYISSITCISVPDEKLSLSPEELAGRIGDMDGACPVHVDENWSQAVCKLAKTHPGDLILTCGSLYLAGRILAQREASGS